MGERAICGFDSEDDGRGNPFLWCFTHASGRRHFTTQADALNFIENYGAAMKAKGKRAELWATNLEYDLCNLFPQDRVTEPTWRFGRSFLCGATWRGVDFRDTIRHVPASVAALGEMVGLKKKEGDLFETGSKRTAERYLSRCMTDAAITYRAAVRFNESYEKFGQHARMTLASTALAIWRDSFWKREIARPRRDVWDAAFEAYHGGRTEAFAVGEFADVTAVDVASMYPWAMTCAPLPVPWGLYGRCGGIDPREMKGAALYDVTVRSELPVPRLPVRSERGTIFPNGRWRGWYVGEELLSFVARGGIVERIHSGIEFLETCKPFDRYISTMYKRKQAARGIERTMFKVLMNGLYGKFGQRGRTTKAVPIAKFHELERKPESAREWNGLVIFSEDGSPPPWSNMVWPAFVTARARVRLADELERITERGGRPLYCDTDSVIFQGSMRYAKNARAIGQFESRGRYRSMLLVGKKEYALDCGRGRWESHAKGVPEAERMRYLTEGRASFQRPTKMREAARDGARANVWREVKKQRRTILRASAPNGALVTPRYGE